MAYYTVPEPLRNIVSVGEMANGGFLAADLFQRKFLGPGPQDGKHIIVLYRDDRGGLHVASYTHYWVMGNIGFLGGCCTDGNVMRMMQPDQVETVNAEGGLMRQTLLYAFAELRSEVDVFFGYCGDERAMAVDLAAGFERTHDEHLIVHWTSDAHSEEAQEAMIEKALAVGPF